MTLVTPLDMVNVAVVSHKQPLTQRQDRNDLVSAMWEKETQ